MVEKFPGCRAAPAFVGRREVLADIAFADTAEQRIGDGVQPDIGIAMAFQPVAVREFDPAQPDVIAIGEFVNVVAGRGADIAACLIIGHQFFGQREIFLAGHFDIFLFAFDHFHFHAGQFRQRNIVGHFIVSVRPVCRRDLGIDEALRCLGAIKVLWNTDTFPATLW